MEKSLKSKRFSTQEKSMLKTMVFILSINQMLESKTCSKNSEQFQSKTLLINSTMKWVEIIKYQEIESILLK